MKFTGGREASSSVCLEVFRPSPVISTVRQQAGTVRRNITINGIVKTIADGAELAAAMLEHSDIRFLEVWADRGDEAMCMLANGDRAWLMYLKNQDEECFSTRNLSIPDDGQQLEFRLSNGQTDFYPCHWTVTRELGTEGLTEFVEHGGRTASLEWHDDNTT
jgi:hypothetical protein